MSYLEIANSTGMWLVCSVIIFVVIFQAAVFMRKAYKTGKEMGLSDEQMQSAMRSGAISTVGPSLAVVVAMISLIVSLGAPFAWMRLSVVGSIPFELMAAETGAVAWEQVWAAVLMMSALLLHQYGPVRWEPAAGF